MSKRRIFLILFAGLLFRLFIMFFANVNVYTGDSAKFDIPAWNLIHGHGYTKTEEPPYLIATSIPPVYPIFLAIIYLFFGRSFFTVAIIQIILDILTCFLVYRLAEITLNQKVAKIALLITIFNPFLAVYTPSIMRETLMAFLVTLSAFVLISALKYKKIFYWFFSGSCMGFSVLCRQDLVIFPFFLSIIILFVFRTQWRAMAKNIFWLFFGLILVLTHWAYRNYCVTGVITPTTYGGDLGQALYLGTVQGARDKDADFIKNYLNSPKTRELFGKINRRTEFREFKKAQDGLIKIAISNIKSNPFGFILLRVKNYPKFWVGIHPEQFRSLNTSKIRMFSFDLKELKLYMREDIRQIFLLLIKYFFLILSITYFITSLVGIWINKYFFKSVLVLFCILFYYAIVFFPVVTTTRYSIPVVPILMIFSASGILYIYKRFNLHFCKR